MTANTTNDFHDPLIVTQVRIVDLVLDTRNPRDHSPGQIRKLRASIREFGLVQPILIDEQNNIIAGNARLLAARDLGFAQVPCIRLTHMSEAQKRAYVIADNKIAELGTWNEERLGAELRFIVDQELTFDLEVTGFETAELDFHILGSDVDGEDIEDEDEAHLLEPARDLIPATQPGDLWICGNHSILCGDAKSKADHARVMAGNAADMIFTDPPYNVKVDGHVRMNGAGHREFAEASGEMTQDAFTGFLSDFMEAAVTVSRDGALHYICMDWRHMGELLSAGHANYSSLLNLCVWNKTNGGMGSFYRSKHELVFVWKSGKGKHCNTIELGRFGRYRTNVWDYAGVNTFGASRNADLADHPTVKPTDMVMDAILDCTKRGAHVLDPFLGSGTTLLAAERCGRIAHGVEMDPVYVDVALRRWQAMTGGVPVHAVTGDAWRDPKAHVVEDTSRLAPSNQHAVEEGAAYV